VKRGHQVQVLVAEVDRRLRVMDLEVEVFGRRVLRVRLDGQSGRSSNLDLGSPTQRMLREAGDGRLQPGIEPHAHQPLLRGHRQAMFTGHFVSVRVNDSETAVA